MIKKNPVGLVLVTLFAAAVAAPAWAKLPPPSDEAKAKAAEAAAKTAHNGKVDNFKLCKSMDRVAQVYFEQAKKAGKAAPPATATAVCEDPGAFVYTPPVPASPAAVTAVAPAAAAAPAAPAPKK
jgi:hypothetical protein